MSDPSPHLLIAIASNRPAEDAARDAVEAAQHGLARMGWLSTRVTFGSADLEDARNTLTAQFHATPHYTDMLCLDDDVSWAPGAIERLVRHPVDVVLAAYPRRAEGEGFSVRTLPGPVECVDPSNGTPHPQGLIRIAGGPAGMLRLSRRAVDALVEAQREDWYYQPKVTGGKAWAIWEFDVIDHERISEDMNLCRKWRALGHTVWCDPHITMHHHGKKTYSGQLAQHLRDLGRLVEPGRVQRIAVA